MKLQSPAFESRTAELRSHRTPGRGGLRMVGARSPPMLSVSASRLWGLKRKGADHDSHRRGKPVNFGLESFC